MKTTLALLVLAALMTASQTAFAQQDLSSSSRDSTQGGTLSGTTTGGGLAEATTAVPATQPVVPSGVSATNNPVNVETGTLPSSQPSVGAVNAGQAAVPLQPMNGAPAGTVNGSVNGSGTVSGSSSSASGH